MYDFTHNTCSGFIYIEISCCIEYLTVRTLIKNVYKRRGENNCYVITVSFNRTTFNIIRSSLLEIRNMLVLIGQQLLLLGAVY